MKKNLLILFLYPDRLVGKTYDYRQGLWLDHLERKILPGQRGKLKSVMNSMNIFRLTIEGYKMRVTAC